ncbi:NAD(P)/FAD-dependent oxidoreductase [Vibrio salinus]|uniref:NAD(P)/FAD-dependent oxidoreductase n=1 Tax=Vibrio salinus TaxID=2899784 RepID=UPI001E3FF1DA|nr:FAD-binding oxidoreductase [Vibrio salinus]MCE0494598.1 FAD-binding oxidoreductase [Vibrio salinus]
MKQPHADSYYAFSANQSFDFPELTGEQKADVCVVGAGITGTVAAIELAKKGYSVIVLEAEKVGWGASGRSGGQAIFGWASEQDTLEKLVGDEEAKTLWDMSLEGLATTKSYIKEYNIDCDWRDGMAHLGVKPRHEKELKAWYESLTGKYGYDSLELWDKNEVRQHIDSSRYTFGMLDHNSGHLHPLNYTLGLVKAAKELGVTFYEGSAVRKINHGDKVRLDTERGHVTADNVLLACNAYMNGLEFKLESRVMPVGTYICASEPLGKDVALGLMKDHIAACDINFVLDYFRCSGDYRMLFGGRCSYSGIDPRSIEGSMRKRMVDVFPQLKESRIDFAWGGFVGITMNRAPYFGRLKKNVFYAQGFSGHGIAATSMGGKVMAEAVSGTAERIDVFEHISHMPFPGGRVFRTPALVLAMTYYRIRDLL